MKKNMGTIDRGTRTIIAFVIAILIVTGTLTGLAAVLLGIFAALFLVTSYLSFCPAYLPFKISTTRKQ